MALGAHIGKVWWDSTSSSITVYANIWYEVNEGLDVHFYIYDANGNTIKHAYSINRTHSVHGYEETSTTVTGLPSFTKYTFYITVSKHNSGTSVGSTSGTVYTKIIEFAWDKSKIKGQEVNITANEWNRLLDTCRNESIFVGNGSFSPSYVYVGEKITANIYNDVIDIFGTYLGYKSGLSKVVKKQTMTAILINALQTAINQVIRKYEYNDKPTPVEID